MHKIFFENKGHVIKANPPNIMPCKWINSVDRQWFEHETLGVNVVVFVEVKHINKSYFEAYINMYEVAKIRWTNYGDRSYMQLSECVLHAELVRGHRRVRLARYDKEPLTKEMRLNINTFNKYLLDILDEACDLVDEYFPKQRP